MLITRSRRLKREMQHQADTEQYMGQDPKMIVDVITDLNSDTYTLVFSTLTPEGNKGEATATKITPLVADTILRRENNIGKKICLQMKKEVLVSCIMSVSWVTHLQHLGIKYTFNGGGCK